MDMWNAKDVNTIPTASSLYRTRMERVGTDSNKKIKEIKPTKPPLTNPPSDRISVDYYTERFAQTC
jgi:hypothetical protein